MATIKGANIIFGVPDGIEEGKKYTVEFQSTSCMVIGGFPDGRARTLFQPSSSYNPWFLSGPLEMKEK